MEEEIIEVIFETNKYDEEVRIDRYNKFRHSNGAYYVFVELEGADKLKSTIPEGVKWSAVDEEHQKTVGEFVSFYKINEDNTKFIMALCAVECPTIRHKKVNKDDIDDWVYYMKAVWNIEPDLLTSVEFSVLLQDGYDE